jgi:two-component sensor histidine kinase
VHKLLSFQIVWLVLCLSGYGQPAIDSLYQLYMEELPEKERLVVANSLSRELAFINPDSSQFYGEEAIRIAKELQDSSQLALAYLNTAVSFHVRGRFNEAVTLYNETLSLRIAENDSMGIGAVSNNLGAAYTSLGNYPKALEMLNLSYELKIRLGQLDKSVTTLANIGNIYFEQKKYTLALDYYEKSLQLSRELIDNYGIIRALNNIGLTHLSMDKASEAMVYYEESLSLHGGNERPCSKVHVLDGLITSYYQLGDYDKAIESANEQLSLTKECEEAEKETSAYTMLGKIYLALDNPNKGEAYLIEAYDLANTYGFRQNLVDISFTLYEYYKNQGRLGQSLPYLESYTANSDSLQNRELIEELTRVEMENNFQQERDSIAFEQALAEATFQARIQQEETLRYSLIIGLILAMIFGLVTLRYYQNKARTSKLLAQQNQQISNALAEREVLMREIHHRVKNNLQVVSSLLNVQSKLTNHPDAQKALTEGRDRVLTMAMIHEKLYKSDNLSQVNLDEYLVQIAESVFNSHNIDPDRIQLKTDIEPIILDLDKVINIGLLVNELITNSLKHAFKLKENGSITLTLKKVNAELQLTVSDDGNFVEKEPKQSSYGTRLIATLARGLNAEMSTDTSKGTQTEIKIPIE